MLILCFHLQRNTVEPFDYNKTGTLISGISGITSASVRENNSAATEKVKNAGMKATNRIIEAINKMSKKNYESKLKKSGERMGNAFSAMGAYHRKRYGN